MYKMLLRDVITGEKHWYDDCYYNGKLEKNLVIIWKGPNDENRKRYKLLAWKWQGFDQKLSRIDRDVDKFACDSLLSLDLPDNWRTELEAYRKRHYAE